MRKKPFCFALCAMLFALSFPVGAQQKGKVPRIGFLSYNTLSGEATGVEAFRQGVRERGYVEGRNIVIEYRYANRKRDRLPQLAAELVGLKVAVIVTTGGPPTRAAKRATKTIPIVMTIVGRPVPRYVESLSRPGGNITGLTARSSDFAGKRMELLKEAFPQVSKVALLRDPSFTSHSFRETEAAAHAMGLQTQSVEFRGANDLESALAAITKGGANALIVLPFPGLKSLRGQIIELAAKSHLPAMYQWKNFVRAGGFMAYGPNLTDNFRRAAYYVDRLLKGTKPGDLPVEQPRRFDLSINLKTAKQLGITIPPEVLFKATEVIK